LQLALDNPLTSYDEVPSRYNLKNKEYIRPTLCSTNRQMPSKQLQAIRLARGPDNNVDLELDLTQKPMGNEANLSENAKATPKSYSNLPEVAKSLVKKQKPVLKPANVSPMRASNPGNSGLHKSQPIANGSKQRGFAESLQDKQKRSDNRDRTLAQIDQVLETMNEHVTLITAKPSDAKHVQKFNRKPKNSIESLMNIVDEVVDEFNS
jgi:hypothetical protein